METIRNCVRVHFSEDSTDIDDANWKEIQKLRIELGKDSIKKKSLLTQAKDALDDGNYDKASELQLKIQLKVNELIEKYASYVKNIF